MLVKSYYWNPLYMCKSSAPSPEESNYMEVQWSSLRSENASFEGSLRDRVDRQKARKPSGTPTIVIHLRKTDTAKEQRW